MLAFAYAPANLLAALLPNIERASVTQWKIVGYLLSSTHPEGAGKAKFFMAQGFSIRQWEMLARALMLHAANNEVSSTVHSTYGTKYIVDGRLECPNADKVNVRVIWIMDKDSDSPRLVTAYAI